MRKKLQCFKIVLKYLNYLIEPRFLNKLKQEHRPSLTVITEWNNNSEVATFTAFVQNLRLCVYQLLSLYIILKNALGHILS